MIHLEQYTREKIGNCLVLKNPDQSLRPYEIKPGALRGNEGVRPAKPCRSQIKAFEWRKSETNKAIYLYGRPFQRDGARVKALNQLYSREGTKSTNIETHAN